MSFSSPSSSSSSSSSSLPLLLSTLALLRSSLRSTPSPKHNPLLIKLTSTFSRLRRLSRPPSISDLTLYSNFLTSLCTDPDVPGTVTYDSLTVLVSLLKSDLFETFKGGKKLKVISDLYTQVVLNTQFEEITRTSSDIILSLILTLTTLVVERFSFELIDNTDESNTLNTTSSSPPSTHSDIYISDSLPSTKTSLASKHFTLFKQTVHTTITSSPLTSRHGLTQLTSIISSIFKNNCRSRYSILSEVVREMVVDYSDMYLSVLNDCLECLMLEEGGDERIVKLLRGECCKNLLLLSQVEGLDYTSLILRIIFTMFLKTRNLMKLQFEIFFTSVHLRILEAGSYGAQVLALESLVEFIDEPKALTEVYGNYDCDLDCSNLYLSLIKGLLKFIDSEQETEEDERTRLSRLGVIAVMEGVCVRMKNVDGGGGSEIKRKKDRIQIVVDNFNSRNKNWMETAGDLVEENEEGVAKFLFETKGVDRTVVGEYLSKGPKEKYPFNTKVLYSYLTLLEYSTFLPSLRLFLLRFRMPGEAQCIDRLMEAFSEAYFEKGGGEFKTGDGVFVMAFSIIMLNTDLHNPNMEDEKRMTVEQFVRNNRGIDGGGDLDRKFLVGLYHDIKGEEIQVQQTASEAVTDVRQIDGLLKQSPSLMVQVKEGVHAKDMFKCIAPDLLAGCAAVFEGAVEDEDAWEGIRSFERFGEACGGFGMEEEFNDMIVLLLRYGREFCRTVGPSIFKNEECLYQLLGVGAGDIEKVVVGGASYKGLLALRAALGMVKRYAGMVRNGWVNLLECLFLLRSRQALPDALSEMEDFADAEAPAALRGMTTAEAVKGIVGREQLDVAFATAANTSPAGRAFIIKVLLQCRIRVVGDEVEPSPCFEDQASLSLELASRVLLSSKSSASQTWPLLHDHVANIIKGDLPYLQERAAVVLLGAFFHLDDGGEMRALMMDTVKLIGFVRKEWWDIIFDLCSLTCSFASGRGYIFSGLQRCLNEGVEGVVASGRGVRCIALLLRFSKGDWEGDMRNSVESMKLIANVWSGIVDAGGPQPGDERGLVEICSVFHELSKGKDVKVSKMAAEQMGRILSLVQPKSMGCEVWTSIFRNVLLNPPAIHMVAGGGGNGVYVVNEEKMIDRIAELFKENVTAKSNTGFIFESTIHSCINMVNVFGLKEFKGGKLGLGEYAKGKIKEELKRAGVDDNIWGREEEELLVVGGEKGEDVGGEEGGTSSGMSSSGVSASANSKTTTTTISTFDPSAPPLSNPQDTFVV
ncbi:hypothetical protein TL16_g09969 [Triparma laevis f. inornata]|uniref:SEC7 domain-containing protein n=1 Tax=Triparma laevis f. inornata TaxID=1714386 RepID=A0A9W7BEB5_9STRA|nr:hypothetical protein TL16_g09969 [Triparma laevis f. inornata]